MNKLNKLYFLKIEIKEIKEEIDNLSEISSPSLSGMPHSKKKSDPTQQFLMKKQKLIEKLNKKLERYIEELTRIENFIDDIDDPEIRTIARLRFIENFTWEDIGKKMHQDRSVCYRKIKKYIGGIDG